MTLPAGKSFPKSKMKGKIKGEKDEKKDGKDDMTNEKDGKKNGKDVKKNEKVAKNNGEDEKTGSADLDLANAALHAAEQSLQAFNDDLEKQMMQAADAAAPAPWDAAAPIGSPPVYAPLPGQVPPILEPPYAPPVNWEDTGCSRCRWAKRGCKSCRAWATAGLKGYYFGGPDPSGGPRVLHMARG